MRVELLSAGVISLVLGLSHAAIGVRGVLPHLRKDQFSATWFGSRSLSAGMVRFTWHVTTILLLGFAALLMILAVAPDIDGKTLVLRWLSVMWFASTPIALFVAGSPRGILRFPVAFLIPLVAVLCWIGSV